MLKTLLCLPQQHDMGLVAVSLFVCITACLGAFGFQHQAFRARGEIRAFWLALTGVVAGAGIWTTHFVGMLAFAPRMEAGYGPGLTLASLLVAVAGAGAGFAAPVASSHRLSWLFGGVFAGSGVAAMHFLGVSALDLPVSFTQTDSFVEVAIGISVAASCAAFFLNHRLRGAQGWLMGACAFAIGIGGLHYVAMAGVVLGPPDGLPARVTNLSRDTMAIIAIAMAGVILVSAFVQIWVERLAHRSAIANVGMSLDVVPAGLAFFDMQEGLIVCNKAFREFAESIHAPTTPGTSRRKMFEAATAAGWFSGTYAESTARYASSTLGDTRAELHLPDGRWLLLEGFRSDHGSVGVIHDITDQKTRQESLKAARDAAEAASASKSAFLANMSHEIRTPLNGVLGILEVVKRTELTEHQAKLLGTMQESGEMLNALLTDLLDLAKAEAGAVQLRPEPTEMAELLSSVCDLHRSRAQHKGIELNLLVGPGAGDWVVCDPLRLRQVLGNLVNNAVKFTQRGSVTIAASRYRDHLTIEVRDTGDGFDDSIKATLFKRFQQADNSGTRKFGGAGLGLAISDQYVRLMGGRLDCQSQPGKGSTFSVDLSLPREAPPTPLAPDTAEPVARSDGAFRALIVDDNATNRKVLSLILESVDVGSAEAENGVEGVAMACRGGFDVVFMDIQMPEMDGLEAIRRIRAWEAENARPRTPIYIVSANALDEHVASGVAAGADGHICKPVTAVNVLLILQGLLPDPAADDPPSIGDEQGRTSTGGRPKLTLVKV